MFNYEMQVQSEVKAEEEISIKLNGYYGIFPEIIDLSFALYEYKGEIENVDTVYGGFQSRATIDYSHMPYTLNSIFKLTNSGYYFEAQILVRQLFETLVQLRYFHENPEKFESHITDKPISLKKMINSIDSGTLYENYRVQSMYAHGFATKYIQRHFKEEGKDPILAVGNFYHEDNCTIVLNHLFDILLGMLNLYDKLFYNNIIEGNKALADIRKKIINFCVEGRKSHVKKFPSSKRFHKDMGSLIFFD